VLLLPVASLRSLLRMLLLAVLLDLAVAFIMKVMLAVTRLPRAAVACIANATPAKGKIELLSTLQLFVVVQQISDEGYLASIALIR
jgi:hypothetical protein